MGDFLLDFRSRAQRDPEKAVNSVRFYADMDVKLFDSQEFSLILSRPDNLNIWGPYKSEGGQVLVALVGRIAMDSGQWAEAEEEEGDGGLACKAIFRMYKAGGIHNLENLNGNFVVILHDARIRKLYVVVDRCGMFPCFSGKTSKTGLVLSSHPDLLAAVCGFSEDLDLTSMAEFLTTGKVSFPYSYYKRILALDFGCIHMFDLKGEFPVYESMKKYFLLEHKFDSGLGEWDLAEELSAAIKRALKRRTLSMFGRTAVALSGGLDSRTFLCSIENRQDLCSFCLFDKENLEYRISKDIAREAGVELIPIKRPFDYYADNAEEGVRVFGGMGCISNNHFLGLRKILNDFGIDNIITGFYCDYLFKGLAVDINKKIKKVFRFEKLSKFDFQWYESYFDLNIEYKNRVMERLSQLFPENIRNDTSDIGRARIEKRRIFPLCYESDNAETTIAQRVMPWYLPIVDTGIIEVYLKIPTRYKLNLKIFSKVVRKICGEEISKIQNCNTGTGANSSLPVLILSQYKKLIERKMGKNIEGIATEGSWPNWEYYIHNSKKIERLWLRKNELADDVLGQILGRHRLEKEVRDYLGIEYRLFFRLLTLKLWLDVRIGTN